MRKHVTIGETYGNLTVIKQSPYKVDAKGRKTLMYECECVCGKHTIVRSNNLLSGNTKSCGCQNVRKLHERCLDLLNQVFGRLTVIEKVDYRTWRCLCECGNVITTTTGALRSGNTKSCGCYQKQRAFETNLHDLTGQHFGKLTVLQLVPKEKAPHHNRQTYYQCLCECGNVAIVNAYYLTSGMTKSCGCLHSWGEHLVEIELKKYQIPYEKGFSFPDLIGPGKGQLIFDFCIYDNEHNVAALIEYQGQQHYTNGPFGKEQREVTDNQKKEYCHNHNYTLYEIKYDENIETAVANIIHILHANTVPSSNEIEKV